jgi:D-alanyl-D-alanine carboxypeptidase
MPEERLVRLDMKRVVAILLLVIGLAPALAAAVPQRAPGAAVALSPVGMPAPDGRLFGHIPYVEAPGDSMVTVLPGFGIGQPCRMRPDAAGDLVRLLHAADADPAVAGRLRGVSCYRTIAHQHAIFCRSTNPAALCHDPSLRAREVGPPGFSEHATGYAIDFGIRPSPGCPDVEACIADTVPGQWLLAHAPAFGFELSFPAGNAQNVTWEPWHWRWVGTSIDEPGAARARLLFARARSQFPASPAVDAPPAPGVAEKRPIAGQLPEIY